LVALTGKSRNQLCYYIQEPLFCQENSSYFSVFF